MYNADGTSHTDVTAKTLADRENSAYTSTSKGGYCHTGAGYGVNYNSATKQSGGAYPGFFKADVLSCAGFVCSGNGITVNGLSASWKTKSFHDRDGNFITIQYLGH